MMGMSHHAIAGSLCETVLNFFCLDFELYFHIINIMHVALISSLSMYEITKKIGIATVSGEKLKAVIAPKFTYFR